MRVDPTSCRVRRERGSASLAVTLIMLVLMALVALYVNRGLIFEQRTSANQYRATRAFETAEAGLDWAISRLNNTSSITVGGDCSATAAGTPFLDLYAPYTTSGPSNTSYNYTPPNNSRAACSVADDGALTCHCPSPGTAPSLATPGTRNFRVTFLDVPADPEAIRITSHGCVSPSGVCDPNSVRGEATASVTTLVKRVKGLNGTPAAALITGGWAEVCGSYNISTSVSSCAGAAGTLVNSGNQIRVGSGEYLSGPMPAGAPNCGGGPGIRLDVPAGTPIAAVMAPNDSNLAALSQDPDAMFYSVFGQTIADYQNQARASGCFITGNTANARGNAVIDAYSRVNSPCDRFWIDGDASFSGSSATSLGSAANNTTTPPTLGRQVVLASQNNMTFNGDYQIYGIVYADSVNYQAIGTGTSDIFGAVIARNNYQNNGNGSIHYDACGLAGLLESGQFERVPGSWIDDVPNAMW